MRDFFLHTRRIAFSLWQEDDLPLALQLWGDARVTERISATGRFSEAQIVARLEQEIANQERHGVQYWPIFDKEEDVFLGCCGLRPYISDKLPGRIMEIGIHLLPRAWGQGYAEEAAKAVLSYALEELKLDNLFAGHHPQNLKSQHLLSKLGFHPIGEAFYEPTGLYHPSYLYRQDD